MMPDPGRSSRWLSSQPRRVLASVLAPVPGSVAAQGVALLAQGGLDVSGVPAPGEVLEGVGVERGERDPKLGGGLVGREDPVFHAATVP